MDVRYLLGKQVVEEDIREYIEKRLERIEKLAPVDTRFEVEISEAPKSGFRVEIMVVGPKTHLRAEEVKETIEAATDVAIDELEAQLSKKGGKIRDLYLRGKRSIKKRLVVDKDARF